MYLTLEKKNKKIINYFYAESLCKLNESIREIKSFDISLNATLYTYKEEITCNQLLKLKNLLIKSNITLIEIYSNSRESIITAESIKIHGKFLKNFDIVDLKITDHEDKTDLTHIGVVRSGDQISSNGNLIIIGDVNPGARISAKKNIYVWGKLCGVAFAGENGFDNSTISSLYLNALQLRINKTVAIGPKEKPKSNYPEIAVIEKGKIIIKPLLVSHSN